MPRHSASHAHRGSLDDFLAAEDIVPIPACSDAEWNTIRRSTGRSLSWQFCTLRNLLVHRGRFAFDTMGFAWGGIYRTLLVGSIVSTSYRNEGHFRAGARIFGTADFFYGGFVFPKSSAEFHDVIRVVNLRHHVAGVVAPTGDGRVAVIPGYEADYAYVATAFIESIRRGLDRCGLAPDSRRGRQLAADVSTILYRLAGFTGLTRMPRDLAAHERFRDAYDRHLRDRPAAPRVRRMAQEIARRIVPFTAFMAGDTVRRHVLRHIDPETREFLFPGGTIDDELEQRREAWSQSRRGRQRTLADIERGSRARQAVWQRPDVAALARAYHDAAPHVTDDRLIGAVLLHALDGGSDAAPVFERRTIDLAAGTPLIRQGASVGEMYVVLDATAPLVVMHASAERPEPRQIVVLEPPTVLGEIGMWRGQPAVATVMARTACRLDVLVIDAARFAELKLESGFRAAAAAEVQRRLAIDVTVVGAELDDAVTGSRDPRLASLAQLFRYLSGDSHVSLDAVLGLPESATPAECVDALRQQIDDALRRPGLTPELTASLTQIASTIG